MNSPSAAGVPGGPAVTPVTAPAPVAVPVAPPVPAAPVRPWTQLPADVAAAFRPHLGDVVRAVVAGIRAEVPAYARPLEGRFGAGVLHGVEVAMDRFLDLPGSTDPALAGPEREVYVRIGRGELAQGRSMDSLLAAYRVGARVAFNRFARLARAAGLEADALIPLAEATFAYIDELSAASAEGWAAEQALHAGQRDRLRQAVVDLLLGGAPEGPAAADAAAAAGWALPERVVVVVAGDLATGRLALALGPRGVTGRFAETTVAVVDAPGSPAERAQLGAALRGRGAVVGHPVPWARAAHGLRVAQRAARLADEGLLAGDPLWADDHLVELVLHRDADLAAQLAARVLAPLAGLPGARRRRAEETLLAWLAHRGERARVAAALHVHPQTVAYRMDRLRALLGDRLDDPDARFALELALRARPPG